MIIIQPLISAVVYTDNFNRANGTAEVAPWVRRMSWSFENFAIVSNQLKRNSGGSNDGSDSTDCMIYTTAPTANVNQMAEVDIVALTGNPGPGLVLGADVAGTSACLWATIATTGWRIFTAVPTSGSKTILASGSTTLAAGSKLRFEKTSGACSLYYGGTLLHTYTGTLPTGLYTGVSVGSSSNIVDNWAGGDFA